MPYDSCSILQDTDGSGNSDAAYATFDTWSMGSDEIDKPCSESGCFQPGQDSADLCLSLGDFTPGHSYPGAFHCPQGMAPQLSEDP